MFHWDTGMLGIIFALAWPTMLEQLMQTAVQYIDTAMVGALGTQATAAVGATSTVNWLIGSTVSAFGVGFLALISQSLGAGEHARARRIVAQAVMMTLVIGLFFSLMTTLLSPYVPVWMQVDPSIRPIAQRYFLILYLPMLFRASSIILGTVLRSAGDTKSPMRVGIAVNVINIVLNALLIYPPRTLKVLSLSIPVPGANWGVDGAAVASAISYAFGGIAIFLVLWRHREISPRGNSFRPDRRILHDVFRIAMPNMFQRFATSLGYVVFAAMINRIGGTATAAHTIANTVESAFYIPGWGMQTVAATLAGQAYGARDEDKMKRLGRTLLPLEVTLMVISGALLFAFAQPLVGMFSRDEAVMELSTHVLRMVAISEPFYGIPIVVEGMMQGTGRTTLPLIVNVCAMWLVRIAGTYLCTVLLGMGLVSAWGCMIGHNMVLFLVFGFIYVTGRWNPFTRQRRV